MGQREDVTASLLASHGVDAARRPPLATASGIPSNPKAQGQIIATLALLSAVAFTVLAVIGVS